MPRLGPQTEPAIQAWHIQYTLLNVKHKQTEVLGSIWKWNTCFATASHHRSVPSTLPCTLSFSFGRDLQKQKSNYMQVPRELLAFASLHRISTFLPCTSFKHSVTPFVCALSCPHSIQTSPLFFQIIKLAFKKQPCPLLLTLKYLLTSAVGLFFWITVLCNEILHDLELCGSLQHRNMVQFPLLASKWKTYWCKLLLGMKPVERTTLFQYIYVFHFTQ